MILKNNLYTIKNADKADAGARYEIELHADSFIYQAHFPGDPITPGVCIVQIAKELLEETIGKKLQLANVKNVKFLSVLTPRQSATVEIRLAKITHEPAAGIVKTQAVVASVGEVKAKLSFTCVEQ